jgi:phosphatidylserine/phosphatidylglycerophosphate/cardiolipin synthase-like enzyme
LEGVRFELVLGRARQMLLPASDGGHQQEDIDSNNPFFRTADGEPLGVEKCLTGIFRLIIDRYGPVAQETDTGGTTADEETITRDPRDPKPTTFDELAAAAKEICRDVDIPDIETLIRERFGVMPVAIVGGHIVYPIVVATALLLKAQEFVR